ncbi:MAG: N-acetylmuramoyl-L-alanine amidase [Lachnospiraceae bacterium]|nr:N-acetylmuramoyl-L-alanine amidase [Lachnospiraceae bacterium]
MSKKKRKQNGKMEGTGHFEAQVNSRAGEASQEIMQTPEIKEIQERKEGTEAVTVQESVSRKKESKGVLVKVLFGGGIVAAILFLAICLYKTSGELETVQTMSGTLQTDLKSAEAKLDELLKREESILMQLQDERNAEGDGVSGDSEEKAPEIEKKPRTTPEPERYTVCIDAGHGAHDTGAVLEKEDGTVRYEKDDNLRLAKLVQKELEAYGIKVLMTREDDSFLELYDRTLLANSVDVEALISFHRNAYYLNGKMNDRVSGVEIWIHSSRPTEARQLANRMLDAILDVGGMNDRGVRYGSMTDSEEDYAINRRAAMTSMIVEMGFISNEEDNEALDVNGEAYAKAIAKEIYDWLVQ